MSVLIKGMEMPTRCAVCWLMDGEDSWCTARRGRHLYPEYRYGIKDRPEWCPLVPVPPHGRLIDADDFERNNQYFWNRDFINPKYEDTLADLVNAAPTIVPASEESE